MKEFSLLTVYFKQHRRILLTGLFFLFLVDGFQICIPWLIKEAINILTQGTPVQNQIVGIGGLILLLAIGIGSCRFAWRYCIIGVSRRIEEDLRNRFYLHLQKLSFSYFNRTSIGDLMAHAINDLNAVRMMCGMALVASADAALLATASLIMMISIDPVLTAYVLIPLPFLTATVLILGPKMHSRFRQVQEGFSKLTQKAQETYSGIRVVKSFVQEKAEHNNFRKLNQDYIDKNLKLVRVWGVLHPLIWAVAGGCSAIILWLGGYRVINGQMSIGEFVAFNSYLGILIWPMIAIGWVVNLYQRGKASLSRLYKIFQIQPEITSCDNAIKQTIHGTIEFRNLSFSYNNDSPVLKNISLTIEKGQWIAIMGQTGSSKSTLVQLVSRLYDSAPGSLFIDGIDIREWDLKSLRSQIGFVPQQSFLFSDTLANNISFGENLQDKEIEEFAKIVKIYKDIELFPKGFETPVGEKGVKLSGGQKQRISIARSIAMDTPILIFDDALSAVDAETEKDIIAELNILAKDKTVLLVSHRISTARHAGRIIFLKDGEIIEDGTHEELLGLRGHYFGIYEHQRLLEEIDQAEFTSEVNRKEDHS